MPIIPNPQTQKWRAGLPGKFQGEILQSWNVDLEKSEGSVSIAEQASILVDSSDITGMSIPLHFLPTDADTVIKWWALSSGKMAKTNSSSPVSGWATDALTSSPTDAVDMVVHEYNGNYQRLVVTRASDIAILNSAGAPNAWTASWWVTTLAQTALNSVMPHPVDRLDRLIAIGDGEFIHTIDQSDVVAYKRLAFSSTYKCIAIYPSLTRFWFVLQNKIGGKGIIAEWDGGAERANVIYEINGNPLFGFIQSDVPYVVTDDGYIHKFNGRGFSIFSQFPAKEERLMLSAPASVKNCAIEGDIVNINIAAPLTSKKMRSGVWALNINTGNIYHRWGLSQYKLSVGTTKDFGQGYVNNIGGLASTYSSGRFLIGALIYTTYNSVSLPAIYRLVDNPNRGYFVTTFIPSSEIQHYWYNLWIRFNKFISSSESIVTKYRVTEGIVNPSTEPLFVTATWVNTTSFTAVIPATVIVGNEVEVMSGDNAGCNFHISSFSAPPDGVSVITVTIDEAAPLASTKAVLVRFDDWIKIGNNNPVSSSTVNAIRKVNQTLDNPTVASGPYIQFKIELRGIRVQIDQVRIDSKIQEGSNL